MRNRSEELEALRKQVPIEWIDWAMRHGSDTLKRAIREKYPFTQLLRKELLELFAPPIPGAERVEELTGWRIVLGDEREPNTESYRMLDEIQGRARAAFGSWRCPEKTELTLLRLRRAHMEHVDGPVAYASASGIEISRLGIIVSAYYVWGRSDARRTA